MTFLTLQVGQCGNQLGPALFDILSSEYSHIDGSFYDTLPWNPFFRMPSRKRGEQQNSAIARSLLIDMEPGVVQRTYSQAQKSARGWTYSRCNCYVQQSGSGNNWAMGYHEYGPKIKEVIVESIRKEQEISDVFSGFLVLQSVAGGTGSGLGAYLTAELGDAFPKSFLLNYCIWPYRLGEVIVQSYNAVLTLAHIMDSSHGIFLAENDTLSEICQTMHSSRRPRFEEMNEVAMHGLSGALLPSKMRPIQGQHSAKHFPGSWTRVVADILSVVCPHSQQKLLKCLSVPQIGSTSMDYASIDWNAQIRHMLKLVQPKKFDKRCSQSFAHFLTLRGRKSLCPSVQVFEEESLYVYGRTRLGVAYSPVPFRGFESSLSLITNGQDSILPVVDAASKAKQMYRSKAFLHPYLTYGLDRPSFEQAFHFVDDQVISHYR